MSFTLRNAPQMDIRVATINEQKNSTIDYMEGRTLVRFKPNDEMGAGRIAVLYDGDFVEYIGENNDWFHVKSIIINRIRNIRHFDGWVRKRDTKLLTE